MLLRRARSLLSKLTVGNQERIVHQLVELEIQCLEELHAVVELIICKAMGEPILCKVYASVLLTLSKHQFAFENVDGQTLTSNFTHIVLQVCTCEFEKLLSSIIDRMSDDTLTPDMPEQVVRPEGICFEDTLTGQKLQAKKLQSSMTLFAQLFAMQLLPLHVIYRIIDQLIVGNSWGLCHTHPPEVAAENIYQMPTLVMLSGELAAVQPLPDDLAYDCCRRLASVLKQNPACLRLLNQGIVIRPGMLLAELGTAVLQVVVLQPNVGTQEHLLECLCLLLKGTVLVSTPQGTEDERRRWTDVLSDCREYLSSFSTVDDDGRLTVSKRVQFLIRDVLDELNLVINSFGYFGDV